MVEAKRPKKKKQQQRLREERRFTPDRTQTTRLGMGAVLLGGLLLGAGLYGQWVRDEPLSYAPYILGAGALVLALGLWFGDVMALPVRVGDAGIAVEKSGEIVRVPWCDLQRISLEGGALVAKASELTVSIPLGPHRHAISCILSEAARRVPDVMKATREELSALPAATEAGGELVEVEALQITGRACAASAKPISFERDARLCPRCAQVYHKEHVPKACVTCAAELAGRTLSIGT
jgi:hypothetical protein